MSKPRILKEFVQKIEHMSIIEKTMKYTITTFAIIIMMFSAAAVLTPSSQVFAQEDASSTLDTGAINKNLNGDDGASKTKKYCGGVEIAFDVNCRNDFSNPILAYLVALLRFLTYGVGIVVILMIVIGGIQYAAAGDNAQSVSAAKNRILNAFIALLLYIFAFAILNFVVPGGLIG